MRRRERLKSRAKPAGKSRRKKIVRGKARSKSTAAARLATQLKNAEAVPDDLFFNYR